MWTVVMFDIVAYVGVTSRLLCIVRQREIISEFNLPASLIIANAIITFIPDLHFTFLDFIVTCHPSVEFLSNYSWHLRYEPMLSWVLSQAAHYPTVQTSLLGLLQYTIPFVALQRSYSKQQHWRKDASQYAVSAAEWSEAGFMQLHVVMATMCWP